MFGLIGMIIVGGIIGWIAGLILGKDVPQLGKIHIFPALLGSIILIFIISLILKALRKKYNKYRLSLI